MQDPILKLNNIPFPISVNESLMPCKGRLIKTPKAREFKDAMLIWAKSNQVFIAQAQTIIKAWFKQKKVLRLDTFLAWPKEELMVKEENELAKHYAQQKDGTNRIKQLHDSLSDILEIDDRYFFFTDCCKVISDKGQKECMVTIRPEKLLHMSEVENYFKEMQKKNETEINMHIKKANGFKIYEQ